MDRRTHRHDHERDSVFGYVQQECRRRRVEQLRVVDPDDFSRPAACSRSSATSTWMKPASLSRLVPGGTSPPNAASGMLVELRVT